MLSGAFAVVGSDVRHGQHVSRLVHKCPAEAQRGIPLPLCFNCHMSATVLACGLPVATLFTLLHFFLVISLV